MSRLITYEEVRLTFENRGCTLLSREYTRAKDKLDFVCTCGRTSSITYDKFKSGQLCGGCKSERAASKNRYTIEHVREVFLKAGCVLLSKSYLNNTQKLRYLCECGNESSISLSKFQQGQRCIKCKSRKIASKISGHKNPRWKATLTEEDRIKERTIPGYSEWRRSVFDRDDYTCQSCGLRGGKLRAHHIEGYARVPDKRVDVDNGITLCDSCHKEYHRKIEHNDASAEGLVYFLTDYREPWYAGEIFTSSFEEEAV